MNLHLKNINVPLVDLKAQYQSIQSEIDSVISEIVRNTSFIQGQSVNQFEEDFAHYCSLNKDSIENLYCASCANGTDALELALSALEIMPEDEVILPSHTFFASIEAIIARGAKPIFVDIDSQTMLIDANKIEEKISSKTKAIIAVHLYGQPCDMDQINKIAKKHNLFVIEDAAQAHGAYWGNKRVGTLGDLACFSFFPGKNLGCYGDGGAVVGKDKKLIERVKQIACHGRVKGEKYLHEIYGRNSRLDGIQAAVLSVKLNYLDLWISARNSLANHYLQILSETNLILPFVSPRAEAVWHLFVVRLQDPKQRAPLLDHLKSSNISAGMHYPTPLHLQPAYLNSNPHIKWELPETEKTANSIISLPLYPELGKDKIDLIVDQLKLFEK